MAAEELMDDAREMAEDEMIDEVDVFAPTGGVVYDPVTKTEVQEYVLAFHSVCKFARLAQFTPDVKEAYAGEATFVTSKSSLHLPVSAPATEPDYKAVCTVANGDPLLLGREFRITGPSDKTYASARRLPIEEVANG